jgi:SAM-dependent methyltransferase
VNTSFSRLLAPAQLAISTEIAADDGMFRGNMAHYVGVGHSALRCIGAAALLAGKSDPARILDLPCGHGRVLRALRAAFPRAEITACDLDAAGVGYCERTFGAVGIVSDPDPKAIQLEGEYDLVWCGSLLTHLGSAGWHEFLTLFERVLAPSGLLVFTTHGRRTEEWLERGRGNSGQTVREVYGLDDAQAKRLLADASRDGFGYIDCYPGRTGYGLSVSRLPFVISLIQAVTSLRLVACLEHGWDDHHDVIACVKE